MERTLLVVAFAGYLLAAIAYIARARGISIAVFTAAAGVNVAASAYRGLTAGHFPFSNMFETMMTLGVCMYLMFLFAEFGMKTRHGWIDAILAAVVVFPSCFIFEEKIRPLPPALQSSLFFPHVATYLIAYAACGRSAILSGISLALRGRGGWEGYEKASYRSAAIGFPLLTAGLLLGGVWAQRAWGAYWSWDPKEMWALITWIVYLVYLHVRVGSRGKSWTVDAASIAGFAAIVITLLVVNLSRIFGGGLHSYA